MPITVDSDVMLAEREIFVRSRRMRLAATRANLAVLGRAKAIRYGTLAALCARVRVREIHGDEGRRLLRSSSQASDR